MIDSHCHLAGEEFSGDLGSVVSRARSAGVSAALCILSAGDGAEAERAKLVREAWPDVRFAAGVHPHQAAEFAGRIDAARDVVRRAVEENRACAVGEIGLDYHYDLSPRDVQRDVFRAQLEVALDLQLPVSALVDGLFADLVDHGDGELDHSAVIRELRRRNGLPV